MVSSRPCPYFGKQLFVNNFYYGGSFNVFDNVWGITTVYQEKRRWRTCSYNWHVFFFPSHSWTLIPFTKGRNTALVLVCAFRAVFYSPVLFPATFYRMIPDIYICIIIVANGTHSRTIQPNRAGAFTAIVCNVSGDQRNQCAMYIYIYIYRTLS
jgi:hypothetical protein